MQTKNLLIVLMMWQMATAEENCPGVKLAAGLGSLLGDIPISSCAPNLPLLPELASGREEYWDGLPGLPCGARLPSLPRGPLPSLPCGPELPSLPGGDFGSPSLPCLPELPGLGDCFDYPYFDEPLPYLKKKKGCGCLARPTCLRAKSRGCGLKKSCVEEKEDCGLGLKIVPLIKKFPLKRRKLDCYDGLESLPCELPHLLSGVVRESIYDRC